MADAHEHPQPPPKVYQTPDWETPTHLPQPSLWNRLLQPMKTGRTGRGAADSESHPMGDKSSFASSHNASLSTPPSDDPLAKETLGTQYPAFPSSPRAGPTTAAASCPQRPSRLSSTRGGFVSRTLDRVLPPHRAYFGRTRRFFLLAVVLPAALLLLLVICLGLGFGLRNRGGAKNLPLPAAGGIHTGDLTYYDPGLGACGVTSTDDDSIVAVAHTVFDAAQTGSDPNANPLCGRKIRIQRDFVESGAGNVSVDVTVADRCVGCQPNDLDLAPAVFKQLANMDEGRVLGSWAWL